MDEQLPDSSPGSRPESFLGSDAIEAGLLTAHDLRTRYRAVYRNVYLADDVALTPGLRARAAWLFAGPDAVLCGISAAAVHGVNWLDVNAPAEVVRGNRRAPAGIQVRSYAFAPEDICDVDGMRVTTVARTVFDLGRLLTCADAVPVLDALMNQSGIDRETVWSLADANPGIRGIDVCGCRWRGPMAAPSRRLSRELGYCYATRGYRGSKLRSRSMTSGVWCGTGRRWVGLDGSWPSSAMRRRTQPGAERGCTRTRPNSNRTAGPWSG